MHMNKMEDLSMASQTMLILSFMLTYTQITYLYAKQCNTYKSKQKGCADKIRVTFQYLRN